MCCRDDQPNSEPQQGPSPTAQDARVLHNQRRRPGSSSSKDSLLSSHVIPNNRQTQGTQKPTLIISDKPKVQLIEKQDPESIKPSEAVMDFRCPMAAYLTLILMSMVLYIADIALHASVVVHAYYVGNITWFIITVVLLGTPSVIVQCVSFQWGFGSTECVSQVLVGFLHVLQLAVPWRYLRLICSSHVSKVDMELLQAGQLRLLQVFTSTVPLVIFEMYIVLKDLDSFQPELIAAAIVGWVNISWVLATTRKNQKEYGYLAAIISWPATCLKLIWRLGEVGVRILLVTLCIALQTYWIFLVLGLHWVTMLAWLLLELILEHSVKSENKLSPSSVLATVITSYIYVTAYINIRSNTSVKYKPILFYCIMFLENTVLLILWIVYDKEIDFHIPITVVIGIAYAFALISIVLYYNCFHTKAPTSFNPELDTSYIQTCVNCKVSCCVQHNIKVEQPFTTQWWMEVKNKNVNTSDGSDTNAPSDFSSVSKTLTAPDPVVAQRQGRTNRAFYGDYLDDTFSSTMYTDSQYMSEYTVDSYYDTASDLPWEHYRNRQGPELADHSTGVIHHRSDSGFSASASLSDSRYSSRQHPDYTDDSDLSQRDARRLARWRHHMMLQLQNAAAEDASESDFFSQSSVASYPSSMPSRKAMYYASRDRRVPRGYHGSAARRIDRSRHGSWSTTSQSTVLGPLGLPTNRHRRRHTTFILDDKLDQIIKDVCNIEKTLNKEPKLKQHSRRELPDRHHSDSDSTYLSPRRSLQDNHRSGRVAGRRAYTPDALLDAALLMWSRPRTPDRLSVSSMVGIKPSPPKESQKTDSLPQTPNPDTVVSQTASTESVNAELPTESEPTSKAETKSHKDELKTDQTSYQSVKVAELPKSTPGTKPGKDNRTLPDEAASVIAQHQKLLKAHKESLLKQQTKDSEEPNVVVSGNNHNNSIQTRDVSHGKQVLLPNYLKLETTEQQRAVWF